jgi:hypothetical protein
MKSSLSRAKRVYLFASESKQFVPPGISFRNHSRIPPVRFEPRVFDVDGLLYDDIILDDNEEMKRITGSVSALSASGWQTRNRVTYSREGIGCRQKKSNVA